jgi:hypothetical protein
MMTDALGGKAEDEIETVLHDFKDDGVLRVCKIGGAVVQLSWASASVAYERPDGSRDKTQKGLHHCRIWQNDEGTFTCSRNYLWSNADMPVGRTLDRIPDDLDARGLLDLLWCCCMRKIIGEED